MSDTILIRKENKNHLRQLMSDGEEHTVYDMMEKSGLSVATVNSILTELSDEGCLLREKRQLNGVGRATWIYRINPEYDSMLLVFLRPKDQEIRFLCEYCYGGLIEANTVHVDDNVSVPVLEALKKGGRKVSSCVITVPPHTGINSYLAEYITQETGIPCAFHDDIYYYAVKDKGIKRQVYMDFTNEMAPAITCIYEGKIITENSHIHFKEFESSDYLYSKDSVKKLDSVLLYMRMVLSVYPADEITFGGNLISESDREYLLGKMKEFHFETELSFFKDKESKILCGMAETALAIRKED